MREQSWRPFSPSCKATTYTYDSMDRLATRKDALNRQESYGYDLSGNLNGFTDRKSQPSTFSYDALNRRTRADYADGSFTTFTYDAIGRLSRTTDSLSGASDVFYDNLDRLILEVTPQGAVAYEYDAIGRRTRMTVAGQAPVTYGYDAASRLTQVAQGALVVTIGYDAAGRRTSLTYPNGTSTTYTYDNASRLTRILYQGPSGVIEDLVYTYDAAGNRISLTRANGTASLLPAAVQAAYDAANQQIQFNAAALSYDLNGNLVNDGAVTHTWDARNRLVGITGPALSASFGYDALGRRISKTINGVTTQFLYDGNDIVQEIGGSAVNASYVRSLNIDEPFVRQTAAGNEFYHVDALGSTLDLTNQTGAVQASYNYEAFGKTTMTGTTSNPFQYTGRENDGTGLYYYRARYYAASLHRFIAEDPLQFNGGDINLFAYVLNSPVNLADPFGYKVIYEGKPPTDPNTIDRLEALDRAVGDKDVIVTKRGGARTQEEQAKINSSAPNSLHVKGKAADVIVPGLTSEEVAEKAAQVGFKGISTYSQDKGGHTHVDTRDREWNGSNGNTLPYRPKWRIEGEKKGAGSPDRVGGRK